jgi:ketol-acid reductoisomerase
MARRFYDRDADLAVLEGQVIAVVGYGNQGRAQALNMRDGGLDVIVGNRDDSYREQAVADGMTLYSIPEAVARGDILLILMPDEVQPEVYREHIAGHIKEGACLVFGHGYNIFYKAISPPDSVDVVMIAPKMIGEGVRRRFVSGEGFPTLVAVEQDATGTAWARTLAVARAIGGTHVGAWESTFEEETVTDLFAEQVGGGSSLAATLNSFETLVEAGYDPEVIQLELYGSGEMVEVTRSVKDYGLLDSLKLHSPTSQYGQLSRARRLVPVEAKETLKGILDEIQSGAFAEEWAKEREDDYVNMERLRAEFGEHLLFEVERRVREALESNPDQADE